MKLGLLFLSLIIPATAHAQTWPNEPAGAIVRSDWGYNSIPAGDGSWYDVYNDGISSIQSDSTAPLSPSNVYQQRFSIGLIGGNGGGGGIWYTLPNVGIRSLYWGFWMKTDANYEQHPVFTKIGWIHTGVGSYGHQNQLFFGLVGSGSNMSINANYQNTDTDNTHLGGDAPLGTVRLNPTGGSFSAGQWVRFEVCFQPSSTPTARDGVFKWWVTPQGMSTSVLAGNVTTLNTQALYPGGVSHITIWGGTGSTKTRDSFIYWDHEHVSSVTNCTGITPPPLDNPPGAPGLVTGVTVTVGGVQ